MIRKAVQQDAEQIRKIYNWYVDNTVITFEDEAISALNMQKRMALADDDHPWFVIEEQGVLVGFTYAAPWKSRAAYEFSCETTVYIAKNCSGKGLGRKLYQRLIDELRESPIHLLVAGIALPNDASVALHEKLGFRKVAHFNEVGFKFGKFIDVGYWQLTI
ncbi:MAG: N-acetyltransferase family protein [Gammaproteobacteria bacterium]|nr:phosphinothricin acetyltransferase [Gammaproteobacteria bacterium]MDP6094447.1 N-acetyltransferase family protein [Gammaproteobacteria bacterium]